VMASSAGLPSSSASTSTSAIPPSGNETAPFSNTTVKNTPAGYRNALYFTNWFVMCLTSGVLSS
jgi:hypothetical protein